MKSLQILELKLQQRATACTEECTLQIDVQMYLMGYFSIKKKGKETVSDREANIVSRGDRCRKWYMVLQ